MTNEFEYQTGIVGAGWLGLPLARALQEQGQSVAVTVSTAEKAERLRGESIAAWPLLLTPDMGSLPFRCHDLVICVPPSKTGDYPASVASLCRQAREAGVQRVLFISATSVWGAGQGEEDTPAPALSLIHI